MSLLQQLCLELTAAVWSLSWPLAILQISSWCMCELICNTIGLLACPAFSKWHPAFPVPESKSWLLAQVLLAAPLCCNTCTMQSQNECRIITAA